MQEFLKTAAANIDSADDLDNDPMSKFTKKYRINVVCLILVSLGLWWAAFDTVGFAVLKSADESAGKLYMFMNVDESLLLRVVLAALFCVNCVLELAAVWVGVYAVRCLKVPAFQLHAQMVSTLCLWAHFSSGDSQDNISYVVWK